MPAGARATLARMRRLASLSFAVALSSALTACGETSCHGCHDHDAGPNPPPDAGRDSGPPEPDAGPARTCPPGPVAPEAFDCASSDPDLTFGDPIEAPDLTWTFVPFPDAFCMNRTATGIGVSINPASDQLVIYLEGGGACFDPLSCSTVAGASGFDSRDFASPGLQTSLGRGLFDRADEDNPVRDASYVYVPYCTGDVHGGTNEDGPSGRMHVGYRNVTAYLRRLVPTFPSVTRVLLTGRSAGGLGTLVNFEQVQRAFDCTPVHLLDDSGALLSDEYLRPCLQATVREAWGLDAVIPEDCPQCTCSDAGGLWNVYFYVARRFPDRRFGLITAMEDATFRSFYGYGYSTYCNFPAGMPGEDYAAGLLEVREALSGDDNFRTFYLAGDRHTFTYQDLSANSVGGVTIATWLTQLLEGDAAWTDVGP